MHHELVERSKLRALYEEAQALPALSLSQQETLFLDLLLRGALRPFTDYGPVEEWEQAGLAVLLPYSPQPRKEGDRLALRHPEGMVLAVLTVTRFYPEADGEGGRLAGTLEGLERPPHAAFSNLWENPPHWESGLLGLASWKGLHRPHQAFLEEIHDGSTPLVIFPGCWPRDVGDSWFYHTVRMLLIFRRQLSWAALCMAPVPGETLSIPLALAQGLVMRNTGCDRITFPDFPTGTEAGDKLEAAFAKSILAKKAKLIPWEDWKWQDKHGIFLPPNRDGEVFIPEKQWRENLQNGKPAPPWWTWPEMQWEGAALYPPPCRQGFTLFFTGLSGSGKSTIANLLAARLMEQGGRKVTLLDGDLVRQNLSSELTFSEAHRNLNIRRIGFVAEVITRNGGIAICAPIAPYRAIREEVRRKISREGGFFEIHVATRLETCEERDRKGLYALARAGKIENFTGISDPYEAPESPEIQLQTEDLSPEESVEKIIIHLREKGYLK